MSLWHGGIDSESADDATQDSAVHSVPHEETAGAGFQQVGLGGLDQLRPQLPESAASSAPKHQIRKHSARKHTAAQKMENLFNYEGSEEASLCEILGSQSSKSAFTPEGEVRNVPENAYKTARINGKADEAPQLSRSASP